LRTFFQPHTTSRRIERNWQGWNVTGLPITACLLHERLSFAHARRLCCADGVGSSLVGEGLCATPWRRVMAFDIFKDAFSLHDQDTHRPRALLLYCCNRELALTQLLHYVHHVSGVHQYRSCRTLPPQDAAIDHRSCSLAMHCRASRTARTAY
jgi:hypothetical protein